MIDKIKKINKVIITLTLSDVLVWGTYLVAYPLQGIYLSFQHGEKSIQYIAIGLSIYYLMRALLQIPIGYMVDKTKQDFDEIWALGVGCVLIGLSFVVFPFTSTALEYYLLMALAGIGASFNLIGWRKLFAKNLDKDREGREYALYETIMSLCTAAFGLISGEFSSISNEVFRWFFLVIGAIIIIGGIIISYTLFHIHKEK